MTPMTVDEAVRIALREMDQRVYSLERLIQTAGDCHMENAVKNCQPLAIELRAALSLLSGIEKLVAVEKAPDGVPEFVELRQCNGCLQPSVVETFRMHGLTVRYRFDGVVEPEVKSQKMCDAPPPIHLQEWGNKIEAELQSDLTALRERAEKAEAALQEIKKELGEPVPLLSEIHRIACRALDAAKEKS